MKDILAEEVDDVRSSNRLTDSPVCLIAPDGGVDMHMERVLKINQNYEGVTKPVLEINADHALIKAISGRNLSIEADKPQPALPHQERQLGALHLKSNLLHPDFARQSYYIAAEISAYHSKPSP